MRSPERQRRPDGRPSQTGRYVGQAIFGLLGAAVFYFLVSRELWILGMVVGFLAAYPIVRLLARVEALRPALHWMYPRWVDDQTRPRE